MANVAGRWVLDQPAVAAIIVGARLGEREHRSDNLGVFSFALDAEDRALLAAALAASTPVAGDCGNEYRRPPYLTASGDLSHHLAGFPERLLRRAGARPAGPAAHRHRQHLGADRRLQPRRARRRAHPGQRHHRHARHRHRSSARAIPPARPSISSTRSKPPSQALGGMLEDVVRTRIYLRNARSLGAGRARSRPLPGPCSPGQYADRGVRT